MSRKGAPPQQPTPEPPLSRILTLHPAKGTKLSFEVAPGDRIDFTPYGIVVLTNPGTPREYARVYPWVHYRHVEVEVGEQVAEVSPLIVPTAQIITP